jgi:hypothetical protein
MLIDEDATVAVKCRTAIQALFLYFNLCPSVKCPIKMDSLSQSYVYFHPYPFLLMKFVQFI